MNSFNLVNDPWIPVINSQGKNRLVSLDTLFREAADLTDLDALPHERISILRLLVCITQAELGAPETSEDWDGFGDDLEKRVSQYLHREEIYPHFNLLGEGKRFLQRPTIEDETLYPISKIIFHYSTGNTHTLLDHEGESRKNISLSFLARSILTFQNFFVGGSMGPKMKGNGPSLKYIHTHLIGKNIKETILLNCLDRETIENHFKSFGSPIWSIHQLQELESSYLGRLCPISCQLWIMDLEKIQMNQGYQYPEYDEERDPFSSVYSFKEETRLLRANLEKGVWKDLHVVAVLNPSQEQASPLNLQSHRNFYHEKECRLWLGELVKAKDAKIIDSIESVFTIPHQMLTERGRSRYQAGVEYAETRSNSLYGAIKQYAEFFKNESPQHDLAKRHYWNALEQNYYLLFEIVKNTDPMPKGFGEGDDPWTKTVLEASRAAYDFVCSRQTPRQLQAYAAGLKSLLHSPSSKKPSKRGSKS